MQEQEPEVILDATAGEKPSSDSENTTQKEGESTAESVYFSSWFSNIKWQDYIIPIGLTGILSFLAGSVIGFSFQKTEPVNHRMAELENLLADRQTNLQIATERLNNEIQISRAAAQHNMTLNKQKEHFQAQYLIQLRNLNLANEEIQKHVKVIEQCRGKIETLENEIEKYQRSTKELSHQVTERDGKIYELNESIEKLNKQIQESQQVVEKQKLEISTLKETHRIFEYVLTKASPELASRIINQIHRVNATNETTESQEEK